MSSRKNSPEGGCEIVFVGRSNVGKSSIIRSLTGVSVPVGKHPGVTRRPYHLNFKDLTVTDMPGFGFMRGVKDRKQDIVRTKFVRYIEENRERIILAVLVVNGSSFAQVVDRWAGRGEMPVEVEMFQFLEELGLDVVVAVNKMDKVKDTDGVMDGVGERLGMLPPWRQWLDVMAPVSGKNGDVKGLSRLMGERIHNMGRDDLLAWIR